MAYQELIAALADPTRRLVFESLRYGPRTVGELANSQTVSRPAVSQHLKVLRSSGLVDVFPHGTRRYYSVRHEGLAELRLYLDSFWSDVLSAYGAEVERQLGENNAGTGKENH